ncbi:hypothetical protein RHAB21_01176 [Pseudorhizobium halotolerans]|uniref:Murein endopeptidase K n=3 Tax=Pseudorhizobium TaxID=1903858 RepID=A0A7W9Z1T2_9HYPH|nr:uncharacterized protein YcbK (DUF882 family) [Pseudorhizobium flavum]CAD6630649.1 hypothetical protein RFYW14_04311 [Pseudorhizobium flavum]CAD7025795.1 hypothetical protein RHAB21_01176 [Pseudorhizobium halotolerans]
MSEYWKGIVGRVVATAFRSVAGRTCTAALTAMAICGSPGAAAAEERALKLFFTHTGERATITYKRDGRFDQKGLAQVNRFLRDWRKNEPARMDPRLLDLVWEIYGRSGAKDYIHIVSAYRSPATNKMLRGRSRSSGVAKNSQHTLGKAMDFYIPGVKLSKLRALAMQAQVGGVGYYPTSGSPFVHLDVGNVRAWPRMSRQELANIFPDGKTMHLPSNGKPLPGYQQAVADYKRRVGSKSIEIASTAGGRRSSSAASSLLTAMLPTPKSRAQEALDLQGGALVQDLDEPNPSYVDLASFAVPLPMLRPAAIAEAAPVETASLGPVTALTPVTLGGEMPLSNLRQPSTDTLGFLRSEMDDEDEFDSEEAIISWALSPPGSSTGMRAPAFLFQSGATEAGVPSNDAPVPMPDEPKFDTGRFWSGS